MVLEKLHNRANSLEITVKSCTGLVMMTKPSFTVDKTGLV